jgi:S1-C subfamily serine protease
MPAGEERRQDFFDHPILSDDDAAKFLLQRGHEGRGFREEHRIDSILCAFCPSAARPFCAVCGLRRLRPARSADPEWMTIRYGWTMNTWTSLSNEIAAAVEQAAPSIVQVHGRRRIAAGLAVAENLVLTPAAVDDDKGTVRTGGGQTAEGIVLGRIGHMGLTVLRVDGLGVRPLKDPDTAGDEPKPGSLAVAVGRTWSGGVMAMLAPVAVVGGPLRTGRASAIDRVIRIQQPPHGALTGGALLGDSGRVLGIITSMDIRDTTVVIPASIAWAAATAVAATGGTKQGFLGVSSMPVAIPERQRGARSDAYGLLINQISNGSPAESAGLLVGDIIVAFDRQAVHDGEELLTRLRGDRVGKAVPLTVLRGGSAVDVTVTVGERPSR